MAGFSKCAIVAVLLVVMLVGFVFADQLVHDPEMIQAVNNNQEAKWTAGVNRMFDGKTLGQVRHMLGAFLIDSETDRMPRVSVTPRNDLPKAYDFEVEVKACKHPIRNQGQCGSCWAFAGAEVMGDRFCKATDAKFTEVLSPQDMVSCDKSNYACQGGILVNLFRYLENTGIVTDKCSPYTSGTGRVAACRTTCADGSQFKKYKAKKGSTKHYANVLSAMTDLVEQGPILTGFMVYRDFFSYKSGVYHHVSGGFAGGHAVKIVGYGETQDGTKYWNVANSWGEDWGENGYFRIVRGTNECQMEDQLFAADADI